MNATQAYEGLNEAFAVCAYHSDLIKENESTMTLANVLLIYQILLARNYTESQAVYYLQTICYYRYVDYVRNLVRNVFRMILGIAGVIGSILQIFVLNQSEFQTVGYTYHRYIAYFEILDGIGINVQAIADTCQLYTYIVRPAWANYMFNFIQTLLVRPTQAATDTITVFMTFERFTILWFPHKHKYLDSQRVSYGVLALSLLAAVYLLFKFAHDTFDTWLNLQLDKSSWYPTVELLRLNLDSARGWIAVVLSVGIIVGLVRRSLKQKALSSSAKHGLRVVDLSLLCLASSVPMACGATCYEFYTLAYIPAKPASLPGYFLGKWGNLADTFAPPDYQTALADANRYAYDFQAAAFFAVFITYIAHMCHFYLNVALSQRYREGFLRLINKNSIVPLTSTTKLLETRI